MGGPTEAGSPDRIGTGTRLADRYLVQQAVGYGGMATVYHGRDTLLDRDVAIKVLNARLGAAGADREAFLREARAAASLVHPNVVAVYDAGVYADWPFIVMEYVSGGTLKELLDRDGALEQGRAITIAAAMADALDYGHTRGVVHADVKPGNILLDGSGRPKLVDFGIAQTAAATAALTQAITGTAAYVAPEQLEGAPLDGRADIYSLGTVLFQMLCGALPFDAPNAATLATRRLVSEPRSVRSLNPAISQDLADVVARCLARYPDERFATAGELARVLRAISRGEPVGDAGTLPLRTELRDDHTQVWRREQIVAPPPATSRSIFPIVAAVLGAVVVVLVVLFLVLALRGSGSGGSGTVPEVRGETLGIAAQQLQAAGFSVDVQIQASTQPAGTVLAENPAPTTTQPKKNPVQLTVSGGANP
jgi:eukaryotic-like serine/threonine-protein kinase